MKLYLNLDGKYKWHNIMFLYGREEESEEKFEEVKHVNYKFRFDGETPSNYANVIWFRNSLIIFFHTKSKFSLTTETNFIPITYHQPECEEKPHEITGTVNYLAIHSSNAGRWFTCCSNKHYFMKIEFVKWLTRWHMTLAWWWKNHYFPITSTPSSQQFNSEISICIHMPIWFRFAVEWLGKTRIKWDVMRENHLCRNNYIIIWNHSLTYTPRAKDHYNHHLNEFTLLLEVMVASSHSAKINRNIESKLTAVEWWLGFNSNE